MKFKDSWNGTDTASSISDAIERRIDQAPDFYSGEVERIKARQDKLIEIVQKMAERLPPGAQRKLGQELGWKVAQ